MVIKVLIGSQFSYSTLRASRPLCISVLWQKIEIEKLQDREAIVEPQNDERRQSPVSRQRRIPPEGAGEERTTGGSREEDA